MEKGNKLIQAAQADQLKQYKAKNRKLRKELSCVTEKSRLTFEVNAKLVADKQIAVDQVGELLNKNDTLKKELSCSKFDKIVLQTKIDRIRESATTFNEIKQPVKIREVCECGGNIHMKAMTPPSEEVVFARRILDICNEGNNINQCNMVDPGFRHTAREITRRY